MLGEIATTLQRFLELGGGVLWAIAAVLLVMWTCILERLWYLKRIHPRRVRQAVVDWNLRVDTTSRYARWIREGLISEVSTELHRHVAMVRTCVALCPLLGLLGTVTGMLGVFDVMAVVGTSDARAMAGGVSRATVPTMAGMVAALSGVYFASQLEHWHRLETAKLADLLQRH